MSGKSKGSMFYVSEQSEHRLWQQVLLILDGKDAQTTSASDLIPRGDGLQVALGGSSAEEQLLAMVSDFGAMKDSSSRIILRKTWPIPQQLPYAISGIVSRPLFAMDCIHSMFLLASSLHSCSGRDRFQKKGSEDVLF